jgi:hypothetical protein
MPVGVGCLRTLPLVPSPIWPLALSPQQTTLLSPRTKHAWLPSAPEARRFVPMRAAISSPGRRAPDGVTMTSRQTDARTLQSADSIAARMLVSSRLLGIPLENVVRSDG